MPRPITTPAAPLPAGHYSQAVVHGGFVFVAGQLPVNPVTRAPLTDAPIGRQTEQVLENLRAILAAAGSNLDLVVKTTVYIADISLWDEVNAVYARIFGDHRPARAIVPTSRLHHGLLVEIDAVAALPDPAPLRDLRA